MEFQLLCLNIIIIKWGLPYQNLSKSRREKKLEMSTHFNNTVIL